MSDIKPVQWLLSGPKQSQWTQEAGGQTVLLYEACTHKIICAEVERLGRRLGPVDTPRVRENVAHSCLENQP